MATSDAGYLLILGAMDSVDDTVLVRKQLILPLCKDIDKLISNPGKIFLQRVIKELINSSGAKDLLVHFEPSRQKGLLARSD